MKKKNIKYISITLFILFVLYFFDVLPIINENMKLTYWIILFFLIFLLGGFMWAEQKDIPFEKIYFITLTILCGIYIILFPPSTVNDEHFHITMAYHYSNVLLGAEENDKDRSLDNSYTYIRNGDFDVIVKKSYYWGPSDRIAGRPDVETYKDVSSNIKKKYEGDNELIAGIPGYSKAVNIVEYLPAALGITLARLLGWNTYLLLYMAKIFNAFAYIFLCCIAIYRIPQFKVPLALVSMLPVALQEATAISYDCVTNGIAFCLFAELILINSSTLIKKKNIILIIVYITILAFCKSGAYIFLVGIGIMELFGKKMELKDKVVGCIILIVNISMIFLYYTQGAIQKNGISDDRYTASFILKQPLDFIGMCIKTILKNISYYIESAMGGFMGWNQSVVPAVVAFTFVLVLLMSTKFYSDANSIINVQVKILCVLVILAEIAVLMAALLIGKSIDNTTITGIQGRYFIPIIPVFLIIITKNQGKKNDYTIVKYFIFVHIIEIYYLMRLYFSR